MHSIHRGLSIVAIVAVAGGCSDPVAGPARRPRQDVTPSAPVAGRVIFLPPLGAGAIPSGASDVSRQVAVEICVRADTACAGSAIARIDTGGGDGSRLRVVGSTDIGRAFYEAVWPVPRALGDTGVNLRVGVVVDGAQGGHVDVRVRGSTEGLRPSPPNGEVVVAGPDLVIQFWIEKPPRRFTVLVGPGVRGAPGASDSLWSYGSRVPYAFAPAPGYENVMVRVDGMAALPVGLVVTDTEHILTVTADRRVVLNSSALPLYQRARAVLSAAEPVGAYEAYLDMASGYVASSARGVDAATQDVRDVEFLAFDPIRDSAALRKVDAALAGHVFTVDSAGGATVSASRQSRTRSVLRGLDATGEQDSTEKTVFLYVNGIATPQLGPQGAIATQFELRNIVSEVPLFRDHQKFDVRLFYNRTYNQQRPTPEQQRAHCVSLFASRFVFGYVGANTFASFMAACTADPSYRRFSDHDLLECVRQMWAIIANTDGAEVDAIALASRIQELRASGLHVILVPHSQGNLMANQAIHRLHSVTGEFDPTRDSTCIGLVSLASPTSRRWELGEHYIAPIVVRGDVVPTIDNEWPPIDTDLSHQLLDIPSLETAFRPTGIILHEVIGSYFLQSQSRAAIRLGLENVYRACAVSSLAVRPTSLTLTLGSSGSISAIALNAFGDTLGGRSVSWMSAAPSVVSVTPIGPMVARAQGVGSGGASVVASRMTRRAESAVLVVKPAPTEDPFSFTYVASYEEGFFGDDQHLSGTVGHPDAVPLPAGTLRLSFTSQFGRLSASVNSSLYTATTFGLDSVILGGNPGSSYRLVWNGDHTRLTGTLDALKWIFRVGFVPALLPVTFERQ
jgi:hypothetical protein